MAMTRFFVTLSAFALLSACGDPLAKVDRLSSVDLAEEAPVASVMADPEAGRQGGFLSGFFERGSRQAPAAPDSSPTNAAVAEAMGLGLPAEDASLADSEAGVDVASLDPSQQSAPERRGLFGFLRAKDAGQPATPLGVAASASDTAVTQTAALEASAVQASAPDAEKAAALTVDVATAEAKPRGGLFGLLAGARAKSRDDAPAGEVQTASLSPSPQAAKQGLFRSNRPHKGPDAQIVAFGTPLASGSVARVCDLPRGKLGKQVGKFPERGKGYKMYDSAPGGTGTRPFYVTGFDDGCARTFTAALALFGSPSMHEQLRYGLPSKVQPYSLTDQAYEGIKRATCGVGKGKPCGAKVGLLEKDTAFISIYDRIGSNAQWSNILLHKGWVLAADRKG